MKNQRIFRRVALAALTLLVALASRAQEIVYPVKDVTFLNYGDGRLLYRQAAEPHTPLNGTFRLIDGYRSEYILADFKDGMLHGTYRQFRREKLTEEAAYTDGRLHGSRLTYYPNGTTLRSDGTFVEGKLNGLHRTYFQDGKVETEKQYHNGLDHGFDRRYNSQTGRLTRDANYCDGKPEGKWVEHLEGNVGNMTRISNYKNGFREGQWSETWEEGTPRSKSSYKEGKKDGVWITYRKNGTQEKQTTYKNDLKNGEEITYFTDGTVEKSINYAEDKRNGVTKEYYFASGKPIQKSEFTYKNGKEEGPYKRFNEDGKLKEEGRCENDSEVYRKLYHSNGKLRSVAEKRGGGWVTLESYDSDGNKE